MKSLPDYYKILEVEPDASEEDIKNSYRLLAKKWHPDVNSNKPESEKKFSEISQAYDILSDKDKKRNYDDIRSGKRSSLRDIFSGGWTDWTQNANADDFSFLRKKHAKRKPIFQIFVAVTIEQLASRDKLQVQVPKNEKCSTCSGKGIKNGCSPSKCTTCDGKGVTVKTQKTLHSISKIVTECSVCEGSGSIVSDSDKCSECKGVGVTDYKSNTKTIEIDVPLYGSDHLVHGIRLKEAGPYMPHEDKCSDLIIQFDLVSHPIFGGVHDSFGNMFDASNGFSIRIKQGLRVTLGEAMFGGEVTVPTTTGTSIIKIPPGSKNGSFLEIEQGGIYSIGNTGNRGNLLVQLVIEMPDAKNVSKSDPVSVLDDISIYEDCVRQRDIFQNFIAKRIQS